MWLVTPKVKAKSTRGTHVDDDDDEEEEEEEEEEEMVLLLLCRVCGAHSLYEDPASAVAMHAAAHRGGGFVVTTVLLP